jgi:hypothetical protein
MGRIVFAVNSGSYSDYSVRALFSTREKAEAFMAAVPDGDYNDIQEFELDPPAADMLRRGYAVWYVTMLRDGTAEAVVRRDASLYAVTSVGDVVLWERTKAPAYKGKGIPDALRIDVWAKDEKSAIKIANEKRAQFIAEGKWPSAPSERAE